MYIICLYESIKKNSRELYANEKVFFFSVNDWTFCENKHETFLIVPKLFHFVQDSFNRAVVNCGQMKFIARCNKTLLSIVASKNVAAKLF